MWISEKSDVRHLSRENFEKFLEHHKSVMVFFYIHGKKEYMAKHYTDISSLDESYWQ